jgi:exodeoxyribonuclease V gamma subunit
MLKIYWSDCLEELAELLFASATERQDPFETECTVVGSPVMAGWLKQYFLYDYPTEKKQNRVLAGWDFKMLHPFVNDWVGKACAGTPIGRRDPAQHPYSPDVLQWRVWNELSDKDAPKEYAALHAYVGHDEGSMHRKRWGLAARLAKLFDDYQNYRVDLLRDWAAGGNAGLSDALRWQAVMWRRLVNAQPETYLKQFSEMPGKLKNCGIAETYRRITVFHTSAMPRAYMEFFAEVGKIMDVQMFIFNPSKKFWIEDQTVKSHLRELAKNGDNLAWMTPPHPILSGFGRGTQAFLATVLDVTEGNISDEHWSEYRDDTLLQKIQADIRTDEEESKVKDAKDDGSLQFHVCHEPLREVEVAKDLILRWFEEHPGSQPRDVQVLVPDMETYAPFIESVFQVNDHNPPIPCSISKRPAVSAGAVGAAFVRLMKFNESRMTAPEALELLELDPVRQRYGLEPDELSEIRALVNEAGIRWGRDGDHVKSMLGKDLPDTVTWRRGLDRLLAGFAVGRCTDGDDVIRAGALGSLKVFDGVEGSIAGLAGKLGQYFEDLCETADHIGLKKSRKVSEWAEFHTEVLERFFRGTESSFAELAEIRRGIAAVRRAAAVAGDPEVGADVMAAAIEAHLGGMAPAGKADVNAVLFSPMRTMQVTPRRLIIMLGLNEGVFPRADERAAFDLLAVKPRYGDRSLRYEDRLAFLEGVMSARERLIITYTGRNISNNKENPPSPAVTEFRQYLDTFSAGKGENGRRAPLVPTVEHRLHGFSPEYYRRDGRLFSYSRPNYEAACELAGQSTTAEAADDRKSPSAPARGTAAGGGQATGKTTVTLEELQEFFVNPAKHFYTRALQVRLPDPARDNVSDSEMFDPDTLEDYTINDALLKDILAKSTSGEQADFEPDDAYYRRLQEQAFIPLGTLGLGRTKRSLKELRTFLNNPGGYSKHKNLYLALRDLRESEKTPIAVSVESGNYAVSGSLPIVRYEDRTFLLRFRYASVKPKDRVRAWVAHVVGHAEGLTFSTDLVGKEKRYLRTIETLPVELAREILAKMLELYRRGCTECLPFAPASSHAYADVLANGRDEEDALEKAQGEWSNFRFPEGGDPYLFEAWGADGPMEHTGFADCATDFWKWFISPPGAGTVGVNAAPGEVGHV